ncbi:hypothetical protein [Streptomyces sp. CB01373]|nr:hypothetical protein [Streptomyces sp. CB01373]
MGHRPGCFAALFPLIGDRARAVSIAGFMWGLTGLLTWQAVRILRRTRRL